MKAVIGGKLYDTAAAEEIAAYSRGYRGDFDRIEETLYKTSKGTFFLSGAGGPRSKYGYSPRQNELAGGEKIIVLTEAEALQWCEDRGVDADAIAQHFTITAA